MSLSLYERALAIGTNSWFYMVTSKSCLFYITYKRRPPLIGRFLEKEIKEKEMFCIDSFLQLKDGRKKCQKNIHIHPFTSPAGLHFHFTLVPSKPSSYIFYFRTKSISDNRRRVDNEDTEETREEPEQVKTSAEDSPFTEVKKNPLCFDLKAGPKVGSVFRLSR